MRPVRAQVILISGATDGLGKAVALQLARSGATLLLHGRDEARGQRTLEEIRTQTGNTRLQWYRADFAALSQVRALAERLLLPTLHRSAPARIVTVSSAGQAPINFRDVMLEHHYDGVQAYCQSKLALVMFTFDLAEELAGTGVTANCLHPAAYMPTKMVLA